MPLWAWACAGAALLSALVFLHDALVGPATAWTRHLEWQAQQAWREPWRAWTAALVHYSVQHLGANLAGCAVVGWFGQAAGLGRGPVLAAAAAWPLTQVLLLWWGPELTRYGGLSGALHAAVAVAALALMAGNHGRSRWIGAAVGAGLLGKVLLEAPWSAPVQSLPGWNIPVAVAAHAAGLLSGTLTMTLTLIATTMRRPHTPQTPQSRSSS